MERKEKVIPFRNKYNDFYFRRLSHLLYQVRPSFDDLYWRYCFTKSNLDSNGVPLLSKDQLERLLNHAEFSSFKYLRDNGKQEVYIAVNASRLGQGLKPLKRK